MVMSHRELLRIIDRAKIKTAIEKAELLTSSEICVSISPLFWGSVQRAAEKTFHRLGMTKTQGHNGVLFFVVPSRRKIVILGDYGIHEKVGQKFWQMVVDHMTKQFREGNFTEGIIQGIEKVAEQLALHFPYAANRDVNELPNEVDFQ